MDFIIAGIVVVLSLIVPAAVRMIRQRNTFIQEIRKTKHILTNGTPASAVVTAFTQSSVQVDDQPEVFLELAVTMESGETFRTELTTVVVRDQLPQFQQGRTIAVKVLERSNQREVAAEGAYFAGLKI
ncbi:hypothetical protein [Paenibacillus sp. FJAT-26967]|uniref:hypothetical protein n=1 Tax=Paenibacillus sp. FJAT-26967 TaxID=1729690 RepID=UPI00083945C9|nr:hypothetical protein [Paenibacillus sp. FJAT-26967]